LSGMSQIATTTTAVFDKFPEFFGLQHLVNKITAGTKEPPRC
jgi:hypothetical protein